MSRSRFALLPLAFALCTAGAAQAVPLLVSLNGSVDAPAAAVLLTQTAGPGTSGGLVVADAESTSIGGGASFTTYQVTDLGTGVGANKLATSQSFESYFGTSIATNLEKLYSEGNHPSGVVQQGAFQIAVWEIINEAPGTAYDPTSGSFALKASSLGLQNGLDALALSKTWLAELATTANTFTGTVLVFNDTNIHPVIYASAVPEPATFGLMLTGLAAIGFVGKRRRSAARG
jgi:PEP-CTERM motif